jgi:hypothetical protein
MNIQVHIERLVLDGLSVAPSQGQLVQAAVEAELARLLASGSLATALSTGAALPVLRAGTIQLAAHHTPAQLGGQIAGAVYSGIGQPAGVTP